ncbi:RNA polymerase-associated protein rtf1 [Coemansia biformis]|uniref:RNA polymerase-associated protein rtf1 n=1 Tax=Coemansia biformis TaxID=1286918 RepID=A0A9W7XZT0_9FUNG|nr:RNA polymerase-associated protein rtf1 [Coemansia biformis]
MDNLENDILELFEDDAGAGRGSERGRGDSRSRTHHKRQRQSRRDEYSGSDDMDMDTDEDVDVEDGGDAYAQPQGVASDNEPLDEWGEDLMGDHKDRRWLASLTEIERERILAERQEKRDILNEQRELRMKLKAGVRVSAGEAGGRATRASRSKRDDVSAHGTGSLSDLKRARERRRRQGETDRWSSPLSDEEESEHESDPLASLEEINSICLPRNLLEQWLFRPFLAEAITGCFVRIVTRTKDSTGEYNQYKMMMVVDVVQGEGRSQPPYHLNKTLTDKYLTLRFGAAEKDYSMETISNSQIKPEEHSSWETALRTDRVRARISASHVQKKLEDLDRARNYQLSEAEVSQMIAERNRLRRIGTGGTGVGIVLELSQLNQLRTEARQNSDWEGLKKIEARLEELNKLAGTGAKGDAPTGAPAPTAHRNLLAPSTSRVGGSATPDSKGAVAARRTKLLTPSAAVNRPSPTIAAKVVGGRESKFALVPELKTLELSLRAKVTPGYVAMMAENGGYDMSFLSL